MCTVGTIKENEKTKGASLLRSPLKFRKKAQFGLVMLPVRKFGKVIRA